MKISKVPFVLACGLPRLGQFHPPQKAGLSPCADISLNMVDAAQVCRHRPILKDESP